MGRGSSGGAGGAYGKGEAMIELEISQFFALIVVGVALLAGLSVVWDRMHERRMAKAVRRETVRCRICGSAYRQEGPAAIQVCPECGSPNRCGRDRRLG